MFDLTGLSGANASVNNIDNLPKSTFFHFSKRLFDIVMCLFLLPFVVLISAALLLFNPWFNRGPLFFIQPRMGRDCKSFRAIKFRSMRHVAAITRSADDPLETDRITRLGKVLRKSRFDELPQIINVLRGDMSLIGPRPDYYDHAIEYLASIPGYRERHVVRPGISGLAQTELGYIEGVEATKAKVNADLYYIFNQGFRLDAWIFVQTVKTVVKRDGA